MPVSGEFIRTSSNYYLSQRTLRRDEAKWNGIPKYPPTPPQQLNPPRENGIHSDKRGFKFNRLLRRILNPFYHDSPARIQSVPSTNSPPSDKPSSSGSHLRRQRRVSKSNLGVSTSVANDPSKHRDHRDHVRPSRVRNSDSDRKSHSHLNSPSTNRDSRSSESRRTRTRPNTASPLSNGGRSSNRTSNATATATASASRNGQSSIVHPQQANVTRHSSSRDHHHHHHHHHQQQQKDVRYSSSVHETSGAKRHYHDNSRRKHHHNRLGDSRFFENFSDSGGINS
ncbi:hypothetical protein C8Q75DRAFT_536543 [Abortiporus biennis]|nr:hypothetical protein C8Q75DRAFT_536543 [Abortiporus biennis]